jgi:ligand-binding sensor domain-containing protein
MKKISLGLHILYLLCTSICVSQNITIGQWEDHYSRKNAQDLCIADNKIYCGTSTSLFYYNTADNELKKLSKTNGLSESGPSKIAHNETTKTIIIGYNTGAIDLIENNTTTSINDIKKENLTGLKTINHIYNKGELAYLSCGFGIVVLNVRKKEIKDTYFIGDLGNAINVLEITTLGNKIYAATEKGLYYADIENKNLNDFNQWKKIDVNPMNNVFCNSIASFQNLIYVTISYDSLNIKTYKTYAFVNDTWTEKKDLQNAVNIEADESSNTLLVNYKNSFEQRDKDDNITFKSSLYEAWQTPTISKVICDKKGNYWIADYKNGLIKMYKNKDIERINPISPSFMNTYHFATTENNIWTCSGSVDQSWQNLWNHDGLNFFNDQKWLSINAENNPALDTIWDILNVTINPSNKNQVFASSYGWGLIEINNQKITTVYNQHNSSLSTSNNNPNMVRITSSCFDNEGNLWVANSEAKDILSVKTNKGDWKNLPLEGFENFITGNLLVTKTNQKWLILPKGKGILVFDDASTVENQTDDKYIQLEFELGKGNIPGTEVYCLTEDKNGYIWVGTDQGIAVFYNPSSVFEGYDLDAQQIKIVKDGNVQLLLETESINSICVDGANRKWISTKNGGVFLISEDGTQQLLAFNKDNSPLPSNNIGHIAINENTGEVYFGTEQGLLSYKSDAIEGKSNYSNVYAYPNPVRENYEGTIAITGLKAESEIKITDLSGKLVYSTKSLGGQATWNGKDFSGVKAKTGVYLVFASDKSGENSIVTKIAFIE